MTAEHTAVSGNKIAVITGGSRGIGRNTVICLARRGVRSILTYNSNQAEAEKVIALTTDMGMPAFALQLDTGNAAGFGDFINRLARTLSELKAERFDYLVNNAGVSSTATLATGTEAELDTQFNVHFKGVFLLTQSKRAAAPPLQLA